MLKELEVLVLNLARWWHLLGARTGSSPAAGGAPGHRGGGVGPIQTLQGAEVLESRYCEHPPETAEHHFDLVCYHYKHTARSSSNSLLQSRAPALLRSRWEAVPAAQGLSGCVAQGDHGGPGHLQVGTARREVLGGHGSPIPRCPV